MPVQEIFILPWLLWPAHYKTLFSSPHTFSLYVSPSPSNLGRVVQGRLSFKMCLRLDLKEAEYSRTNYLCVISLLCSLGPNWVHFSLHRTHSMSGKAKKPLHGQQCLYIREHTPLRQRKWKSIHRRKIRLIDSNVKCRYLKILSWKDTVRQVFLNTSKD